LQAFEEELSWPFLGVDVPIQYVDDLVSQMREQLASELATIGSVAERARSRMPFAPVTSSMTEALLPVPGKQRPRDVARWWFALGLVTLPASWRPERERVEPVEAALLASFFGIDALPVASREDLRLRAGKWKAMLKEARRYVTRKRPRRGRGAK
jgi:hypothetical protein